MQTTTIDDNNTVQYCVHYPPLRCDSNTVIYHVYNVFCVKYIGTLNDIRSKMLILHLAQRFQKWQIKLLSGRQKKHLPATVAGIEKS